MSQTSCLDCYMSWRIPVCGLPYVSSSCGRPNLTHVFAHFITIKYIRNLSTRLLSCAKHLWLQPNVHCIAVRPELHLRISLRKEEFCRRVVRWKSTDVSEEQIFCLLPDSGWFLAWLTLRYWRWRRHVSTKHRLTFTVLHSIISQKIELFRTTAVRT
jgi:hypothetical protein